MPAPIHLSDRQFVRYIAILWNQGWTGTDQVCFLERDANTLTITMAPYHSPQDYEEGRSILVWDKSSEPSGRANPVN